MTSKSEPVQIGIIGGSGLYAIEGMTLIDEIAMTTPFGAPSAPMTIGELEGRRVAFIPRHGKHHEHNPSQVPYAANIWALKQLGVFWVVAVNAVGSLQEEIAPGDFAIPDQIIDKTYMRQNALYPDVVTHVSLSYPFDPALREVLLAATRAEGIKVHDGATYVCMEGPAFSTRAESMMHRQWGAHLIGMTAMPEARLAREAELSYASIALPTDYDVWRDADHVDVSSVLAVLRQNIDNVKRVLRRAIPMIPLGQESTSQAYEALKYAIMTKPEAISARSREDFALVLDRYLPR